jgi:rare lipoprotein A
VQLAALSSREKAEALAAQTGGFVVPAGSLFRVRTGPYATQAQANAAANALHSKGFPQAHMVANDGR